MAEPAGWKLRVWTANTDEEKEGVWKDRYSGEEVDFAPWPPDRPWNGGFAYNCMMLEVVYRVVMLMDISGQVLLERTVSDKSARIYYGSGASEASIADEECSVISNMSSLCPSNQVQDIDESKFLFIVLVIC